MMDWFMGSPLVQKDVLTGHEPGGGRCAAPTCVAFSGAIERSFRPCTGRGHRSAMPSTNSGGSWVFPLNDSALRLWAGPDLVALQNCICVLLQVFYRRRGLALVRW
jgi:hypothetical protein